MVRMQFHPKSSAWESSCHDKDGERILTGRGESLRSGGSEEGQRDLEACLECGAELSSFRLHQQQSIIGNIECHLRRLQSQGTRAAVKSRRVIK
jgi:hypothetical protein